MPLNKIVKFALEKFADHAEIWIGVGFVFILLTCFLIFKSVRRRKPQRPHTSLQSGMEDEDMEKSEKKNLADIMTSLNEDTAKEQPTASLVADTADPDLDAPMVAAENRAKNKAEHSLATEQAENVGDDADLIDELRIPRRGAMDDDKIKKDDMGTQGAEIHDTKLMTKTAQEDRREKLGLFSGRKKRHAMDKTKSAPADSAADMDNLPTDYGALAEIERKLLALRELHDAGLIATEIYLLKTREFAKKSNQ